MTAYNNRIQRCVTVTKDLEDAEETVGTSMSLGLAVLVHPVAVMF